MVQLKRREELFNDVVSKVPGSKVIYGDVDSTVVHFTDDTSQKEFTDALSQNFDSEKIFHVRTIGNSSPNSSLIQVTQKATKEIKS